MGRGRAKIRPTIRIQSISVHYGLIAMEEKTERVEVHLGASILKTLDKWRRNQRDLPSRAAAKRESSRLLRAEFIEP
jgi:hypothetical protein